MNITKERVEELRGWVEKVSSHYRYTGLHASSPLLHPIAKHWDCEHDLLAIIDDLAERLGLAQLAASQVDCPPDMLKVAKDNFWGLIDETKAGGSGVEPSRTRQAGLISPGDEPCAVPSPGPTATDERAMEAIERLIDHVVCDTIAVKYTKPAREGATHLRTRIAAPRVSVSTDESWIYDHIVVPLIRFQAAVSYDDLGIPSINGQEIDYDECSIVARELRSLGVVVAERGEE